MNAFLISWITAVSFVTRELAVVPTTFYGNQGAQSPAKLSYQGSREAWQRTHMVSVSNTLWFDDSAGRESSPKPNGKNKPHEIEQHKNMQRQFRWVGRTCV
jgi:hypothetical protein